jgi:hypothetical protein
LGAAPARYVFEIDVDGLEPSEMYRVEQLRDLFPEATVIVNHSGRKRGREGFVAVLLREITELTRAIKAWAAAVRTREGQP